MVIEVKQGDKFVKIPYLTADVPVAEAPEDGKQYARQDGDWSEVIIPEVDLTDVNNNIQANTNAIATKVDKVEGKGLSTEDYTTAEKTKLTNLPTPDDIVVDSDPRLSAATQSKAGIMTAADKVQLDSTLTATEIENKVNAAVSSVYRVKGTVASVANLPTANVAIGDVYNIADNGANYVATATNPVQWDKLSETVDLTPYMQTSTANSTFVKKVGDTLTGDLTILSSRNPNITFRTNDNVAVGYIGSINSEPNKQGLWVRNEITQKVLDLRNDSTLRYDDNLVWHAGNFTPDNKVNYVGTKEISVEYPDDRYRNAQLRWSGVNIGNSRTVGGNATGIYWKDFDDSTLMAVGCMTTSNGTSYTDKRLYLGWGAEPWSESNNLTVNSGLFRYKGNNIWHAGNDGAGSGLDADLLDGKQSVNYAHYGAYSSNNPNEIGTSSSIAGFQTIFANDSNTNLLPKWESGCLIYGATLNGRPCQIYGTYENNRWFARGAGTVASGFTSWREFAMVDNFPVLTQAEYDALGSKVNSDNKIYFIKE